MEDADGKVRRWLDIEDPEIEREVLASKPGEPTSVGVACWIVKHDGAPEGAPSVSVDRQAER